MPSGVCDPGGTGACGGSLRGGARIFYGGRHDVRRAEHGAVGVQTGGQDHPAAKRAQECHQYHDTLRGSARVCRSGSGPTAGHRAGHETERGGEGCCKESGREGDLSQ